MRAAPSQEEVRRQNLGTLLRFVHDHGAMSRAELTTRMGLNRSTIGALTAELAAAGLVTEEAPRETGRAGRPSLVVSPRSDAVCAYGLAVEVDRVRAVRVGLGGRVLDRREARRCPGEAAGAAAERARAFVVEMHAAAVSGGVRCVGCGVAVSRRARAADGATGPGPPMTAVADLMRVTLAGVLPGAPPVWTGAAADLAAVAEHRRGTAVGCDDLIYLYGDGGVTAGIITGGRRVSGHRGVTGEVGHMVLRPGGRRCGCGSQGCWESEVGEQALLSAAGYRGAVGRPGVRAVVDAAARGDATAGAALRQVAEWLGTGVGNLVNVFNPSVIVFGEALRDIFLAAAAPLRSRLHTVGIADNLPHLRLRTPALGDDAPLIGAAELAFERLLADPLDPAPAP